jgi:superfamily II DNA or RNA helicase
MIKLRSYQQDLLEKSRAALAPDGARVMTQLPTGGGKTEIAGALLKDFLVDGRKAVWLTHREELAEQTEERLSLNWSVASMTGTAEWSARQPAPRIVNGVVILKAQTVSRRNEDSAVVWNNYGSDDLLVIDEAHHAAAPGWERAIEQWPGRVWGLTATPWRLSLREGFGHLFYTLVTGPQTSEMQNNGYLAHSRVFAPTLDDRIIGGEVGQLNDFTEGGIERANDQFVMTTLAVNFWRNRAADRQTVAYAVSKGHAANLVHTFKERGIAAASILSDTSLDDREKAIADFKNGKLTVLVNVAVATEGFDLPDASCIMITRPTKSLALYLQMVGRDLRRKDDGGDCLILDLAGNAEEHGLPEDEREWSLAARGNPAAGDPPVRYCHECNFMAHPAHHKCPQCGADLGKYCLYCVRFSPWSRWMREGVCPIPHEPACDRCHDDVHSKIGVERHDGEQKWLSYAYRAYELREDGNLEAALSNLYLAIHPAKRDRPLSFTSSWVVSCILTEPVYTSKWAT